MDSPPIIQTSDPAWHGTRLWLEEQIALAHRQLEQLDAPAGEHDALRGMIRGYRALIEKVEPTVVVPLQSESGYFDSPPR